jgi:integrase
MATVTLKYVNTFIDRHGRERSYFRFPKQKAVRLIGKPGSPEFMAQYTMALGFAPQQTPLPEAMKTSTGQQTWNAAVKDFLAVGLGKQGEESRKKTRRMLAIFCKVHGHRSVRGTPVAKIEEFFATYHDRPGQHNNLLKAMRQLTKFVIRRSWMDRDPTLGVEKLEIGKHHTWNEQEIAQYETRWKVGTRERTAFTLFLFTGQRGIDVAKMKWPEIQWFTDQEGNRRATIAVQQKKGKGAKKDKTLYINCEPELVEALDAWRETCEREKIPTDIQQHILLNSIHQPFIASRLSVWMAANFDAAKLPSRCVAHGLRKAAARRLAEAGCTPHEIMTVTGHETLSEVQRYCEEAEKAQLQEGVRRKMRDRFRLVG